MSNHPIEELMKTAMTGIENMIDVNTIVGTPIAAGTDILIIPISKVSFGFAAGGSEFNQETLNEYSRKEKEEAIQYTLPFGGGAGAGVSLNPIAFLVVQKQTVRLMQVDHTNCFDKLIDYIPDLLNKVDLFVNNKLQNSNDENCNNGEYTNVPGDNFKCKCTINEEEPVENVITNEDGKKEKVETRVKDIKIEKQMKKPFVNRTNNTNNNSDSTLEDVEEEDYVQKTIKSDGEIFGDEDY